MNADNLYVILVRPQGPMNIGSVCRTMMNFGFHQLKLVSPTSEYHSLDAKKMALIVDLGNHTGDLFGLSQRPARDKSETMLWSHSKICSPFKFNHLILFRNQRDHAEGTK